MTRSADGLVRSRSRRWRTGIGVIAVLALLGAGAAIGPRLASAADCGSLTYHAEATLSGSTWTARRRQHHRLHRHRHAGGHAGRDQQPRLRPHQRSSAWSCAVRARSAPARGSRCPATPLLDVCGTINVTGSGLRRPGAGLLARHHATSRSQHLTLTGAPLYGIFMRNVNNVDPRRRSTCGCPAGSASGSTTAATPARADPQRPDRQRVRVRAPARTPWRPTASTASPSAPSPPATSASRVCCSTRRSTPPSAPSTRRTPAPAPATRRSGWPTATAGSAAATRPTSGSAP